MLRKPTDGETGALVSRVLYYPYGETRWMTGTLQTDYGFTGQRNEAGFGLVDYNARYYDPMLGRFISADTVAPAYENPQNLNRFSYVYNNSQRYVDPTGHWAWIVGLAFAGAALTTTTYLLTTPQDEWDGGEVALVAGVGFGGGALIGTGVGAAAGGSMIAGVVTGAGVGAVVSAETYMLSNAAEGESFDSTDFAITTGFGAAEGAVSGIPGAGPVGRICASGAFAGGESMVQDLADGKPIDGAKAARALGIGLISGGASEAISGGLRPASSGRCIPEEVEFVDLVPTALKPDPVLVSMAAEQNTRHFVRTITRDLLYGAGSAVVEDRVSDWVERGVR